MKISELIAASNYPKDDPELLILRDWGELAPVRLIDQTELAEGDPVVELLVELKGAVVLTADPEE